jgi:hypothetical protein
MEQLDDALLGSGPTEQWFWCLREVAYGAAAQFGVRDLLMAQWLDLPVDLEPAHELWKAGGEYTVRGGRAYVSEVERRRT